MAEIITIIGGRKRLRLGNEELARTMSIGADWGKVRIGMRFGINSATNNLTYAQLVFGLSQGTDRPYKHASCRDFIGWQFGFPAVYTVGTYTAGPPKSYRFNAAAGDGVALSRVAGVTTAFASGATDNYVCADPASYLMCSWLDIQKQTSSTIGITFRRNTSAVTTHTQEAFFKSMEDESTYGAFGNTTSAVTVTGYAGSALWDSVDISWNNSMPNSLEIAELYVLRYQ